MDTMDTNIFLFLNHLTNYSPLLNAIGIFFAEYSQYVLAVILAVLLFYPKEKRSQQRVMVVMALVAAIIARYIIKTAILLAYARPRPFVVLPGIHKLIATYAYENFQSFPSGHAVFFFSLATTLLFFNKKIGIWFFLAAIVMGIARVFVGVHWPSDIVGGAGIGMLTGWAVAVWCRRYKTVADKVIYSAFRKLGM